MLLLLNLRYLISILIISRPVPSRSSYTQQPPGFVEQPFPSSSLPIFLTLLLVLVLTEQLHVARTLRHVMLLLFSRRSISQTVRIGWSLPIAKIRTMPTSTDTSSDSAFFDSFADHYTVLFELFGEYSVKEWITT